MSEASVAEVEQDLEAVETEREPLCKNCGRTEPWTETEWCPTCGYSERFGRTFDLGQQSEDWDPEPTDLSDAIAPWVRILGAGVVALFLVGIAVRFTLPTSTRAVWTMFQVLAGLLLFATGHLAAYMAAVSESDKFGPVDLFMKPFGIWRPTTRDLPKNAWRIWCAGWGVTAVLVAVAVVGGINWMGIFEEDWGFKKSAEVNLVKEVTKRARAEREGGPDTLEEALDEVAGEEEATAEEEKKQEIVRKEEVDVLVLGYVPGTRGRIQSLMLASMFRRKLQYVGSLPFATLPDDVQAALTRELPTIQRPTPFVDVSHGGTWVEPQKVLRVNFVKWSSKGRLDNPVFDEMLEDVN